MSLKGDRLLIELQREERARENAIIAKHRATAAETRIRRALAKLKKKKHDP